MDKIYTNELIKNGKVKSEIAILLLDDERADLAAVGGKGASLGRLANADFHVPTGFFVTTAAYRDFLEYNELYTPIQTVLASCDFADPESVTAASEEIRALFAAGEIPAHIAEEVITAYAGLPGNGPAVAVRSSATAEDLPDFSFAGQQDTYLNIKGPEDVLQAVKRCWASLWTPRAIDYRQRHGIGSVTAAGEMDRGLGLAVVVQIMVPADAAGILFTANPVNGERGQLMISAAWGLGEAVVGGLVTPDTLIIDKEKLSVLQRETAEKQLMTVLTEDGTEEQPVPKELRRAPVLDDAEAVQLATLGRQIEKLYEIPMDIEWAMHEGAFAILQARPITALPEPEPEPPSEWQLPPHTYMAVRNNIVEMMAAPLTPLFSTLGLSAINSSLGRILSDFFGRTDIMPKEIIITVNNYAYYNGSLKAASIGRILWGSIGIARRMFSGAVERWTEEGRPEYVALVERKKGSSWLDLSSTELLVEVHQLAEAAIDAYGALVSGVIPAAWISEGLFTFIYNSMIKWKDDPEAAVFLLGFNSTPIRAEKALYDLSLWAKEKPGLKDYLTRTPTERQAIQLTNQDPPQGVNADNWHQWQNSFQAHLQRYGHTIYNLDFANPTPADDPTPLLEMCKLFISGQGSNPHLRQEAAAERREQATQTISKPLGRIRRNLFDKFLSTAQRYAPLREDGLADVGLGYPLLRQMVLEIGRRFAAAELIEDADDIFWMTQDEVYSAAEQLDRFKHLGEKMVGIPTRKAIWRAASRTAPPRALPIPKLFGVELTAMKKRRAKGNILKGVAASPGQVTGTARVLHGPEDFSQMKTGDIIVADITTPAWTPLFVRASAVVTDVGGPLSHGSIVAREYGIPAVLGTGEATGRIRSGDIITVDGNEGRVHLERDQNAHPQTHNPETGEWNDSLAGDFLWSNANLSEALPEVMTPSTWSLWRIFHEEVMPIPLPTDIPFSGNIGGRAYANVSLLYSLYRAGSSQEEALSRVEGFLGRIPSDIDIPMVRLSRWQVLGIMPAGLKWQHRSRQLAKRMPSFIKESPERCRLLHAWIQETDSAANLITLFRKELRPALLDSFWMVRSAMKLFSDQGSGLREELEELVGKSDTDLLLSNLGGADLESLGPLIGLMQAAKGEMSHDQYINRYGHRGPNECEIYHSQPADDPHWFTKQLASFDRDPLNVEELLSRQDAAYQTAVLRLEKQHPGQAQKILKRIEKLAQASRMREAIRSEMIRIVRVVRTFALKAGELTHLDDDGIFFLSLNEILEVLAGLQSATANIPARRETYDRYRALPTYPTIINGRFDPYQWAADPERRGDVFDSHMNGEKGKQPLVSPRQFLGFAGAAGIVEGVVRCLKSADEGDQLQAGEILVTVTTNVGWTPLFPRASAIVTDVGAPLSHAAIVARELGIPAVVGCGDATMHLKTGDRVRVDGGKGIVEIIN